MAYRKLLVSWCVSARTSGIFASSKQTTSVANPMGLAVQFSGLPPEAGCRAGFTIPVRNGQSRPVTEHRPPAWGQHGVLYKNRTLMTAFTFRSCWTRHLPHGAHGSVFNIGLSELKA